MIEIAEFTSLKHIVNGKSVLDIESLSFESGKIHAIVGHNGAGKTTLLRILAGLDLPTAGKAGLNLSPRDIIMCFQRPYLFQNSVLSNILYGLRVRRMPTDDKKLDQILNHLELRPLLERSSKALSAGEMQRVALARALVCSPRMLLLDEPTASLDTGSVAVIENEIRRFNGEGGTVIIATHITECVNNLEAKVLRLEQGRLVEPELNNILSGEMIHQNGETFLSTGDKLRIKCVSDLNGQRRIAVPASEIVLSTKKLESSTRNQFEGNVKGIRLNHNAVEVVVDLGVQLTVSLTFSSYKSMNITLGMPVFISFKATAVKVF